MPYRELYASTETVNHLLLMLIEQQDGLTHLAEELREIEQDVAHAFDSDERQQLRNVRTGKQSLFRAIRNTFRRKQDPS